MSFWPKKFRLILPFLRFLEVAAQHNGQIINASKIGRDSGTDFSAILRYFEILNDTLLGFYLEPYHRSVRKIQTSKAKFYFFDTGVKRALEGSFESLVVPQTYAYGKAFEHILISEVVRLKDYSRSEAKLYYLRTKDDLEIDLIIEKSKTEIWAVEFKSSTNVDQSEIKKIVPLAKDLGAKKTVVVSRESKKRNLEDFEIWPWQDFLGEVF